MRDKHLACVIRIGCSNVGRASVIYLMDGTKITVGRDKTTKGSAWLEVSPQEAIKAQATECRMCGGTGQIWNMPDERHEICWLCKGHKSK